MKMKRFPYLILSALIVALGFSSCSKSLYGKGKNEKASEEVVPEASADSIRVEDLRVVPTLPSAGHHMRVLYGVPTRPYQHDR